MPSSGNQALSIVARTGFAARAAIYLIVGGFIASAAFRPEQQARGIAGALQELTATTLGAAIVVVLAGGLACLAGWLAIAGIFRRANGNRLKRWLMHFGMLGDAAVYIGFMALALGLALGWRSGGDSSTQEWTAWLFGHAYGRVLVGLIGGAVIAGGLGFVGWAWIGDIERPLDLPPRQKHLAEPISRYGLSGRGAAIALVGGYLLAAAVNADPSKAHCLGGVLNELRQTSFGAPLLILFALAFGASGFFDLLEALYRRVDLRES